MALIPCKACGQQISSRAKSCPKCGATAEADPASAEPTAAEPAAAEPAAAAQPREEPDLRKAHQVTPPSPSSKVLGRIEPVRLTLPADHESAPEEWFYLNGSGRIGPVRLPLLRALAAAGQIPADTQIWKAGLLDWVKLSEYSEAEETPAPVEEPETLLPVRRPSKGAMWWVALAPAWGVVIQIVATELTVAVTHRKLSYYAELWWITLLLNIAAAYWDYLRLGDGEERSAIKQWYSLAVPFYIYRREQMLEGSGTKRLWVWVGSFLFSVGTLEYLNNLYAKILAG